MDEKPVALIGLTCPLSAESLRLGDVTEDHVNTALWMAWEQAENGYGFNEDSALADYRRKFWRRHSCMVNFRASFNPEKFLKVTHDAITELMGEDQADNFIREVRSKTGIE